MPPHDGPVYDPAARVIDAMGREWAAKTNDTWGVIGGDITVDDFASLVSNYGPVEVLG